ncbi:MAG: DUF1552 domain-containing protein, partial [Pirellulales bacterium]
PSHQPLRELKDDFSILTGVGHRDIEVGHAGGDTFLTGANLHATPGYDYKNSISLDQVAAEHLGQATRFPSIELSRAGGTGSARATHTMSYSREGVPLAAENDPRLVFDRLFREDGASSREQLARRLVNDRSILDLVQEDARALDRRLGRTDKRKLNEYLTAVRAVEKQVGRSQDWLNVPKPPVGSKLNFDVNPNSHDDLRDYVQTMFDLLFLAFRTDTTRVGTFQIHREVTGQVFNAFLGFSDPYHGLSHHGGDPAVLDKLARIARFHVEQLAYFLKKLKAAEEADGSMLDRTLILYGSGMNNGDTGGHYATNIPLLFAGGRGLGVRQGRHLAYRQPGHAVYQDRPANPPLTNLFVTVLEHLGIPAKSFSNSTGRIGDLSG